MRGVCAGLAEGTRAAGVLLSESVRQSMRREIARVAGRRARLGEDRREVCRREEGEFGALDQACDEGLGPQLLRRKLAHGVGKRGSRALAAHSLPLSGEARRGGFRRRAI